ncbi:hypothetical protein ABID37_003499 [Aquamicrobium terrae]|uniref:DUF982 domain-containing protein n=1 Tax=Aquamicrobium terrae TaxID=1324945 RepID=A0ABV2N2I0_9HYPH
MHHFEQEAEAVSLFLGLLRCKRAWVRHQAACVNGAEGELSPEQAEAALMHAIGRALERKAEILAEPYGAWLEFENAAASSGGARVV